MRHCATGQCRDCTRRRARRYARPVPEVPPEQRLWETKTGRGQDMIGWFPPGGFGDGYKTDGPARIEQFVKEAA